MLPQELAWLIEEYDPDDLNIRIENALYENDSITITFNVYPAGEEPLRQRWVLRTARMQKFRIQGTFVSDLEEFDEHPFLWPLNELCVSLYIKKSARDPNALFLAITDIQERTLGESEPIGTHLNLKLKTLCALDNGLFADGPLPLLKQYEAALRDAGCEPYIFGGKDPRRWDGRQWSSEKGTAKILLFGGNWIMAESFTWERLSSPN